jgi:hypothetical protein
LESVSVNVIPVGDGVICAGSALRLFVIETDLDSRGDCLGTVWKEGRRQTLFVPCRRAARAKEAAIVDVGQSPVNLWELDLPLSVSV